ncbi:conserved hypothetical protein [Pantoea brenneri]|uniref:Transposase n=1 Tax=Pantoea brenneri TaxID=472694 RepID=A0AAX3J3G1_9GAMM|nr:conserved hypothetical protein [Pantoea brenneri]
MPQGFRQRLNTWRMNAVIVAEQYPHFVLTFFYSTGRRDWTRLNCMATGEDRTAIFAF